MECKLLFGAVVHYLDISAWSVQLTCLASFRE